MNSILVRPLTVLGLFAAIAVARPATADDRAFTYDSMLTNAAAVPAPGTVRFSVGGGGMGIEGGTAVANVSAAWAFHSALAAYASGVYEGGKFVPALALRWQVLSQDRTGVNLQTSLRLKSVGFNPNASEVELEAGLGRVFGAFSLIGNLVAGHGLAAADGGADVELHSAALWSFTKNFSAGLDARYRTEIEPDKLDTNGLSWDLIAGPTLAFAEGPVRLQGIVGYGAGRGLQLGFQRPGLFGLAMISTDI